MVCRRWLSAPVLRELHAQELVEAITERSVTFSFSLSLCFTVFLKIVII
jgi:hypothetical protein